MATQSTRDLISGIITRLEGSKAPTATKLASTVKMLRAAHDSLPGIRPPIEKQAVSEQRNDQWKSNAINKAFGAKFGEIARLQHEIVQLKRSHIASRPGIPSMDKSDFLAAMETISVAQRVAGMDPTQYHKLTPQEKIAALRVPTLAKIPPQTADFWHDEIVRAEQPERLAVYQEDAEALRAAEDVMTMVKTVFQEATGFVDRETGRPNHQWAQFEREHLAPIQKELEAQEEAKALGRAMDAVSKAKAALQKAEIEQNREEIALLKAL